MSSMRNFAPWIAFSAASVVADWGTAATIALGAAALSAVDRRRRHAERDDLAVVTLAFFSVLAAVAAIAPSSPVHTYIPALSPAVLGLGAGMSILRGRPFTIPYAKRSTPPELWDQPRFYDANVTITLIWTVCFFAAAVAIAAILARAAHPAGLVVEAEVLGFVVPMRCTAWYRRRLRARYDGATSTATATATA
jgi:hypothetical protein